MKKMLISLCVLIAVAGMAWQGYGWMSTPAALPVVERTEPVTRHQQAWRTWQEQVAEIKQQYRIDAQANAASAEADVVAEQTAEVAAISEPQESMVPATSTTLAQSPLQADHAAQQESKGFERDAQAFWNEPVDEIWAQQSSQQIVDYFAGLQPRDGMLSVLNEVECRSSRCKLEVVHDDQLAVEEFELEFPIRMAGQLQGITYQTDERVDGRIAVVMYLSK